MDIFPGIKGGGSTRIAIVKNDVKIHVRSYLQMNQRGIWIQQYKGKKIIQLLFKELKKEGKTIICVTHDEKWQKVQIESLI